MMVTNSMLPASSSSSASAGKVMQARAEQGGSTSPSQTPKDALSGSIPSFRLNSSVAPEQLADAEAAPKDLLDQEITSEDMPVNALLNSHPPTEATNLATQAQALMQGIVKTADKQGQAGQLASQIVNSPTQNNGALTQANSAYNAQVSHSKPVKGLDLQALLSQPVQGHSLLENSSMPAAISQAQHANPATPLAANQTQGAEWAAVRVDTSSGKWGEQMMQVLQDRVTLQAQQNLQEAKIRLDPPDLGKLDLLVRVEGDRLSVQINATNAVTREALIQVSERLRAELQEQNFVHVDVNVGSDQGHERPHHDPESDEVTILAAREAKPLQSGTAANYSEHWLNTQA